MLDDRSSKAIKVKLAKAIELIVKEQSKDYNSTLCEVQLRLETIYDTIDNSIFRKFLKYCNPKIHLDANTFIFSNEHRELHFIKYGVYNDSKDEYLVIIDGTSKTNFYILSRKGNLKHNSSTQHIYNDILNELRARGFYTV